MNKLICAWCAKSFNGKIFDTRFVFCCDGCKQKYEAWRKNHEKKYCGKDLRNKAYEEVIK